MEGPDDVLIVANSFERRCLFAVESGAASGYAARRVLLIEYESANQDHARAKAIHREAFERLAPRVSLTGTTEPLYTQKYDVIRFQRDIRRRLATLGHPATLTIDISTFTKCTLVSLLSIVRNYWPSCEVRCVWTPAVYPAEQALTRGVRDVFAVPGFGGMGDPEARILVVFLGQEADRTYSLWRAVDPSMIFLIAGESAYSRTPARKILENTLAFNSLCDCTEFTVNAVDPNAAVAVLRQISSRLRDSSSGASSSVAVACLGTKLQTLGLWSFLSEIRDFPGQSWTLVYASPRALRDDHQIHDYYPQLIETTLEGTRA